MGLFATIPSSNVGTRVIFSIVLLSALSVACSKNNGQSENPPGWGSALIKDEKRYAAVPSLIISYVDYPIFDIHLLLSADNETAFRDSITLPSVFPDADTHYWGGKRYSDGGPGTIAWDRTWSDTKQYKIWWRRVVDPVAFAASTTYDAYTTRASQPGTAWCEAIVVLNKPLPQTPGHFVLHFYPDGRVESDLSALTHDPAYDPPYRHLDNAEDSRHTRQERNALSTLRGVPCIREIPNPYFGLQRPVRMY